MCVLICVCVEATGVSDNPRMERIGWAALCPHGPDAPFLPVDVLWRQKEQFSDGVGYSWIDGLKEHAERVVSDIEFKTMDVRFPHNTPQTKEAAYFRSIFHRHFPNNEYGNGARQGAQPPWPTSRTLDAER